VVYSAEIELGGRVLSIETGKLAKQANGAALVRFGDTVVLAAVVAGKARADIDYFPLFMDYREKTYAAGKIPGGFFKREGRPTTKEILTMRLMDRPLRPLFPKAYKDEVQIQAVVLSADQQNDPDVLAMIGAGASLSFSSLPFPGSVGAVRVGCIGDELVLMPTVAQLEESDLDLVVAGTPDAVTMVEAGAREISEAKVLEAIEFGHEAIKKIAALVKGLAEEIGVVKDTVPEVAADPELASRIRTKYLPLIREVAFAEGKMARSAALSALRSQCVEEFEGTDEADTGLSGKEVAPVFEELVRDCVRGSILDGKRSDGRSLTEIRPITCEVGIMPMTHGSSLFTRGETQALVVATLGTSMDEQKVDGLQEEYYKKFMLHYNFPPFCVGEVKPIRGPSRRDIGHGALAERALDPVVPREDEFPYTVRIVSDILESNGSSSMATVCGATMCMMDAGIPIKRPVSGIAMGLIKQDDRVAVLSDILGSEDHLGDMDFKVAGTAEGITALQMDIKITGVTGDILKSALQQAHEGRMHILGKMTQVLAEPRPEISKHAPRLLQIKINPEKIGSVIGPGGKMIRRIQADSGGAVIEIEDDGTVTISSTKAEVAEAAREMIEGMTAEVEIGRTYEGTVSSVKDFGAFVEIVPGTDGLVHISELSEGFVKSVSDVTSVGARMKVKVIDIDGQGRIRLSRKAVLKDEGGAERSGGA